MYWTMTVKGVLTTVIPTLLKLPWYAWLFLKLLRITAHNLMSLKDSTVHLPWGMGALKETFAKRFFYLQCVIPAVRRFSLIVEIYLTVSVLALLKFS